MPLGPGVRAEQRGGIPREVEGQPRSEDAAPLDVERLAWPTLPPMTRLVLVSVDLLDQFGARNEQGYRVTAEWGEQRPEGWWEPVFTVHYDQPLPSEDAAGLDVERLDDALARLASDGYIIEVTGQTIANEYAHLATPAPKEADR